MSTYFQSKEDAEASAKWVLIDATDLPLGRLASQIAHVLRGKHRPTFTKHVNGGDFVVVINAEKVKFTGKKREQKMYYNYSGFIGGLREQNAAEVLSSHPERVIISAVKGMLPHGALGHNVISRLKVYGGSVHPHLSQQPQVMTLPL